ncbi:MAG: PP2C family protein-serine/threonine phosphatase [Candidatus Binatia bacterium]
MQIISSAHISTASAPDPGPRDPTVAVHPADTERILIVDDSSVNRRILRSLLDKQGYELFEAADGASALDIARCQALDLALLDVMMPGLDGYQVCVALKADRRTADIPIIFLSALSDAISKTKGLELGAVDYIGKPFDGGEVLARVQSHLRIRRLTNELRNTNRDLVAKQRALDADLRAAASIQRSLVAKVPPSINGLTIAWRFIPCDRIGGDIFNFAQLDEAHLAAYIVDVSGHGVPAAMVTVSVSQSLLPQAGHILCSRGQSVEIRSPSEVLEQLDREYPIERFEKHFTMCYLVLDHTNGRLRYSLAGHPMPVLLRSDGTLQLLEAGGPIIGLNGLLAFAQEELVLRPGDRLFLYTDGLVEFENLSGNTYGEPQLHEQVKLTQRQPLEEACDHIVASLQRFGEGCSLQDDVTLVAIEFQGATAPFTEAAT